MRTCHVLLACLAALMLAGSTVDAATVGSVTGTVRVEKTRVKTDGPKSSKDVVVYLEPAESGSFPPVEARVEMDQRGLVFIPHVMAIQKGTTVQFLNNDNDRHNVYFLYDETGETLDIGTWGPGQSVSHTFQQAGVVITLCQLHLEMAAYIVVFDHPFFTVVEIDGESQEAGFRIDNVPPGRYVLKAWHKKLRMQGGAAELVVTPDKTAATEVVMTTKKYAR